MRYTESRLTAVAEALLEGIDEDAVDFRPTYDGESSEPVVLPARFPNLLANGAAGIAVGMATSIPPHNIVELVDALALLLKNRRATTAELLKCVPGPDFPTGGVLVEPRDGVREAYNTGRGSFRLRARWHKEPLAQGQYRIVVSEIPYQVQKSRLIERIALLLEERKLPLLADVHDESTEKVRLVLEPKSRNVDPGMLMELLFRSTDLEIRVPLNLNVLDAEGTPRVMNLKEALLAFLDHRRVVLQRRSRLAPRGDRPAGRDPQGLHDRLRQSGPGDPHHPPVRRRQGADDEEMAPDAEPGRRHPRHALARLAPAREEIAIRQELEDLADEDKELKHLLGDETPAMEAHRRGDRPACARNSGPPRCWADGAPSWASRPRRCEVPLEALVEREPVTVIGSEKGWLRAAKGHGLNPAEIKYKEGDGPRFAIEAMTTDKLLVFATNGRFYTLAIDKLPGGRGLGEPFRLMADLDNEHDIASVMIHKPGSKHSGGGERRARLHRECRRRAGADAQRQAGDAAGRNRRRRWWRPRPRAIPSRWWARTASCCSSRSPRRRRWRAGAASSSSAITRAASPMRG